MGPKRFCLAGMPVNIYINVVISFCVVVLSFSKLNAAHFLYAYHDFCEIISAQATTTQEAINQQPTSSPGELVFDLKRLVVPEGGTARLKVKLESKPNSEKKFQVKISQSATNFSCKPELLIFTKKNWRQEQTIDVISLEDQENTVDEEAELIISSSDGRSQKISLKSTDDDLRISMESKNNGVCKGEGVFEKKDGPFAIEASPKVGYRFTGWSGPDSKYVKDLKASKTTLATNQDANLIANFTLNKVDIVVVPKKLEVLEGDSGSFLVRLSSQPEKTKQLTLGLQENCDLIKTLEKKSLTFTSENWRKPQNIIFSTIVDKNFKTDKTNITCSIPGIPAKRISVTIFDRDQVELATEPNAININEGEEAKIKLKLTAKPGRNITVSTQFADNSTKNFSAHSQKMLFSPENWNQEYIITIRSKKDVDVMDSKGVLKLNALGRQVGEIHLSALDEDELALSIDRKELIVPEGDSSEIQISLTAQPQNKTDVFIRRQSGDTDFETSVESLTFDSENWNKPQKFSVALKEDDDIANGKAVFLISSQGMPELAVSVLEKDNDELDIVLDQSVLEINEGGEGKFGIMLNACPNGPVTVDVAKSNGGDSDINVKSTSRLVFTPNNWNVIQNVYLEASENDSVFHPGQATFVCSSIETPDKTIKVKRLDNDRPVNLTIKSSPEGGGKLEPELGPHLVAAEKEIPALATPNDRYLFSHWLLEGDARILDLKNPKTSFVINGPSTITAVFDPIASLKLISSPAKYGDLIPRDELDLVIGNKIQIIAVPNPGYAFISWSISTGNAIIADPENSETEIEIHGNTVLVANFAFDDQKSLQLISPNGGETWRPGQNRTITWLADDSIKKMRIELTSSEKAVVVLSDNAVNNGSFDFVVPELPSDNFYRVRVSGVGENVISDDSDNYFSILENRLINLTSPNGGEIWENGSVQSITWLAESLTGRVGLALYRDNVAVGLIGETDADAGIFEWRVTDFQDSDIFSEDNIEAYHIRISSLEDAKCNDRSDQSFQIANSLVANLTMANPIPKKGGRTEPASGSVLGLRVGEPLEIKANPTSTYRFVKWECFGDAVIEDIMSERSTVVLNGNAEIRPLFASKNFKSSFQKIRLKINCGKVNNDSVRIVKASLPEAIQSGDLLSDNSNLTIMIDEFKMDLCGAFEQSKKSRKTYLGPRQSDSPLARAKLFITSENGQTFWSLYLDKVDLSGKLHLDDGLNVFLKVGECLIGASGLKVERNLSWRFKENSSAKNSSALHISGKPFKKFKIDSAGARISETNSEKDSFWIRKGKIEFDYQDFFPEKDSVSVSIDTWRETFQPTECRWREGKGVYHYSSIDNSGSKSLLTLDLIKGKWSFRLSNSQLNKFVNSHAKVDFRLRLGDFEGALRLRGKGLETISYPKKNTR